MSAMNHAAPWCTVLHTPWPIPVTSLSYQPCYHIAPNSNVVSILVVTRPQKFIKLNTDPMNAIICPWKAMKPSTLSCAYGSTYHLEIDHDGEDTNLADGAG